jgi:hypothetical protein
MGPVAPRVRARRADVTDLPLSRSVFIVAAALEQFYCTNSAARWDRVGRVIRRPAGARFSEPLQYAFAKVAWDGHVVLIAGIDQNPPVAR